MNKKLWVDDLRPVPDETWDQAFSFHEAIYMLERNNYEEVSLDHDLGMGSFYGYKEMTGRDILNWLQRRKFEFCKVPKTVRCHSANSAARHTMVPDCEKFSNE